MSDHSSNKSWLEKVSEFRKAVSSKLVPSISEKTEPDNIKKFIEEGEKGLNETIQREQREIAERLKRGHYGHAEPASQTSKVHPETNKKIKSKRHAEKILNQREKGEKKDSQNRSR